ncbi:hypothetical protein LFM09_49360 [Lentzea alba]|uniref:hypothetical protein n=1 Tax=Lentzea alba TaxID=2714351 RepID=UPI0039BF50A7
MKISAKCTKRIVASAGAIVTMSTAALLATASPASAAGPGQLEVCSYGNYASYVKFPWRGGRTTTIVDRGACRTFYNFGTSSTIEPIEVRGIYNTSTNTFWVQNGSFRPSKGGVVATYGTTAAGNHWALTPAV